MKNISNVTKMMRKLNENSEYNELPVPTNPEDHKKILGIMQTITDSMTRIAAERDLQKAEYDALAEQYPDIPKKFWRMMATTIYNQNFQNKVAEAEEFELLYANIVKD